MRKSTQPTTVRSDDDEEWWYNEIDSLRQDVGSVTTITETPKKRRQKIYRRRIGFLVNIDELIEAE